MKTRRFWIIGPDGSEPVDHPAVGSVLSKAMRRAEMASEAIVLTVREYEDDLYRVVRVDGSRPVVHVQTLR